MNEQIVLTIAQAILKNTEVLQSLVDALPHETKVVVAEKVTAGKPATTSVKEAASTPFQKPKPSTTVTDTVTSLEATSAPASEAPEPAPAPQPAPVVEEPAAPAPQPAATKAPFKDQQGLVQYVMDAYKKIGPSKGAAIQGVLTSLGHGNINDVPPKDYDALYAGVEALKSA